MVLADDLGKERGSGTTRAARDHDMNQSCCFEIDPWLFGGGLAHGTGNGFRISQSGSHSLGATQHSHDIDVLAHSSARAATSLVIVVVVNNRHRFVLVGRLDLAILFGTGWCLCLWVGVLVNVLVFALDV